MQNAENGVVVVVVAALVVVTARTKHQHRRLDALENSGKRHRHSRRRRRSLLLPRPLRLRRRQHRLQQLPLHNRTLRCAAEVATAAAAAVVATRAPGERKHAAAQCGLVRAVVARHRRQLCGRGAAAHQTQRNSVGSGGDDAAAAGSAILVVFITNDNAWQPRQRQLRQPRTAAAEDRCLSRSLLHLCAAVPACKTRGDHRRSAPHLSRKRRLRERCIVGLVQRVQRRRRRRLRHRRRLRRCLCRGRSRCPRGVDVERHRELSAAGVVARGAGAGGNPRRSEHPRLSHCQPSVEHARAEGVRRKTDAAAAAARRQQRRGYGQRRQRQQREDVCRLARSASSSVLPERLPHGDMRGRHVSADQRHQEELQEMPPNEVQIL
eukprot:Rhum_TRINITY_DN14357_c12_g1::Rhum_TRINITY_DN14357_c12_g1_i1::g.84116::m.84116